MYMCIDICAYISSDWLFAVPVGCLLFSKRVMRVTESSRYIPAACNCVHTICTHIYIYMYIIHLYVHTCICSDALMLTYI